MAQAWLGDVLVLEPVGVEAVAVLRLVQQHQERDDAALVGRVVGVPDVVRERIGERSHAIRDRAPKVDLLAEPRECRHALLERRQRLRQVRALLRWSVLLRPANALGEVRGELHVVPDAARHLRGRRGRAPVQLLGARTIALEAPPVEAWIYASSM